MLPYRQLLIVFIFLSVLVPAISSHADEETEDLIDIAEGKGKIIAIIEGKQSVSLDLQSKEEVSWSETRGHLAAVLTNERFLVISESSSFWQIMPLRLKNSEKPVVTLSPYLALLVTGDRAIGFDAKTNQFIETRLPVHDELIAAEADKYVAVVVTSGRALGLAVKSPAFSEIRLHVRESVNKIKLTSGKVTVHTSDRFLTYSAKEGGWNEHRF